jgi:hypothetical protein
MNKRLLKTLLFPSVFILLTRLIQAQPLPCGTTVTLEQKDFEIAFADSVFQVIELNRTFHLAVFVTEDNKGQPNINPADINTAVSDLNNVFDRIKTNFSVYSVTYIDNYHFDEIHMGANEQDMITQNAVHNVINLYLVLKLYNNTGQEICGFAHYPADSTDVILLSKSCLNGTSLIEQVGHLFNLYHTHETIFGNELVVRTNCKTTGDRCCDTPADPDLTLKVSSDCQFAGNLKDPAGDYYFPTTANFMSSSPVNCRCYFSDKQYRRMIHCMQQAKQYLW